MLQTYSKIFKEWKDEAGVKDTILISAYPSIREEIKICTSKPGPMIGKGGELLEKYKAKLKELNPKLKGIIFVETDPYYIR